MYSAHRIHELVAAVLGAHVEEGHLVGPVLALDGLRVDAWVLFLF